MPIDRAKGRFYPFYNLSALKLSFSLSSKKIIFLLTESVFFDVEAVGGDLRRSAMRLLKGGDVFKKINLVLWIQNSDFIVNQNSLCYC